MVAGLLVKRNSRGVMIAEEEEEEEEEEEWMDGWKLIKKRNNQELKQGTGSPSMVRRSEQAPQLQEVREREKQQRNVHFSPLSAALGTPFLLQSPLEEGSMMDNSSLLILLSTNVKEGSKSHDILPKRPRGFHFLRTSVSSVPLIRARGMELRWPGQALRPAVYKQIWGARELCRLMKKNITPEGTKWRERDRQTDRDRETEREEREEGEGEGGRRKGERKRGERGRGREEGGGIERGRER
ncbi:hypothetical protein L345_14736, partial [Ophiophagus hannah]